MSQIEYTLVFIKNLKCGPCNKVFSIWEQIKQDISKDFSNISFEIIEVKNFESTFDQDKYPKNMSSIVNWYPTIFLINKKNWEKSKLDKTYILDFNNNAKLMGLVFENGIWKQDNSKKYDIFDSNSYTKFTEDIINTSVSETKIKDRAKKQKVTKNNNYDFFNNQNDNLCSINIISRK